MPRLTDERGDIVTSLMNALPVTLVWIAAPAPLYVWLIVSILVG